LAAEIYGGFDYARIKQLSAILKDSAGAELSSYVKNIDAALSTRASESTLSAVKANTDRLDVALSALRDALKRNEPAAVLAVEARTTNGNTYAAPLATDYGSVITFFLDVTAVSGTAPTLDVYIDIQDPVSGKWVNQDKFPQVTATGTWALSVYVRSNKYAVRWVLGGTTPSFTFSVGAVIIK